MTPPPAIDPADDEAGFDALQLACRERGLSLTASRRAILRALLTQHDARDAVPLLLAAQSYHASTSIGTVYRFLRELEQRQLVEAIAQPHGRLRWRVRSDVAAAHTLTQAVQRTVMQFYDLLATLEKPGLAQANAAPAASSQRHADPDRTLAVLTDMAGYLGYRLLPGWRPNA